MKPFYFLTIILFSLSSHTQNCNIGNETTSPDLTIYANFLSNYILGVKYTLSEEGTLNSLNLIGNDTGSGVQMAVYDDNSGVPNNLMASSPFGTVGDGITSLPVTPTLLPAGDYWIMAVYEVEGSHVDQNEDGNNIIYYQELTYGDAIQTNASGFEIQNDSNDILYFLGIDCGNTLSNDNLNLPSSISIFPNPASDFISIPNLENKCEYLISNQLGQEIIRGIIGDKDKIDIRNLNNGLYYLKFKDGNTVKFIKN